VRASAAANGLTVHAVAGTCTVLLGFDLADPAGCLGFAIRRTDHDEGETRWLRGMKTFESVVPNPPPGSDYSSRTEPIQAFQWGDYTAKPGHRYNYDVSAMGGEPSALVQLATATVEVTAEAEDDGIHGIWFNRGVAGSQAFEKRFPGFTPGPDVDEADAAMVWLSRGLGEAFTGFCAEATGPDWGLRGAFYEFTWGSGLTALAAAHDRGADVALVIHGRDSDSAAAAAAGEDGDTTAADAHVAAEKYGLTDLISWRTAPNKSALMHDKFLVLLHKGKPTAVWTGSTNLTRGAVFGHSNVGHLIRDATVARDFHDEWQRLQSPDTTAELRALHESDNPVLQQVPATRKVGRVFSPRATTSTVLQWYADLFDGAGQSAHITGAFGLNAVFRDKLAVGEPDRVRTVLLDKVPPTSGRIPLTDPNVRLSTGSHLSDGPLDQWAAEHLTGFNAHVKYIHTKIILIDPLTDDPTVLTGSANYSGASTTSNEENTVVIRGGSSRAAGRAAVRRVADIYLTEYHRLFMHFVFRAWAQGRSINDGQRRAIGYLDETDAWSARYYRAGAWEALQRKVFSGQG
jgi:phosphatidylserine/phosphatidylglycerophosphate/cardiolipin synthase-like enzyme